MIKMYNEESGEFLGEISQAEYQFLQSILEEESMEDVDYYISAGTIDLLEARGADADLVSLLRQAVGESDGIEITWVHPE